MLQFCFLNKEFAFRLSYWTKGAKLIMIFGKYFIFDFAPLLNFKVEQRYCYSFQ